MLYVMLFGHYPFEEVRPPSSGTAAKAAAAEGPGGGSVVMTDADPEAEAANVRLNNGGQSVIMRIMQMQWQVIC